MQALLTGMPFVNRLLFPLVALSFAGLLTSPASAQAPQKDDIINSLAPKPLTRSLGGAKTRKIEVVGAAPEAILEEVKGLPSIAIRVLFATDSDRLTLDGEAALRPLGEALRDPRLSSSRLLIGGHTDAAGSDLYNQDLSERRAQSVRRYLVQTYGVNIAQLEARGFGFKKLADPLRPLDGVNRRVEVVNLTQ